jgi:ribosomal protein S18 acetylase RimI-like enzyme
MSAPDSKSRIETRTVPLPTDAAQLRRLLERTSFFSAEEVDIALELLAEREAEGEAPSGYRFLFADFGQQLAGYACFGRIPLTRASWDLYWIAVDPTFQGQGIGRLLLGACEETVRAAAGHAVYADTSTRQQYAPTRAFYEANGYQVAADLPDFYAPGDGKRIYCKRL